MNIRSLLAFFTGVIFSFGLLISQMVDPAKVLNFLDVFGNWDPSLMLVMGSALCVYWPAYFILKPKMSQPLFGAKFHLPRRTGLDMQLITGAVLFGIGWGITGLCPGPALANIAGGELLILLYVAVMCFTMVFYQMIRKQQLQ